MEVGDGVAMCGISGERSAARGWKGRGAATPKIREGAVATAVVGSHGDLCEEADAAAGGGALFRW